MVTIRNLYYALWCYQKVIFFEMAYNFYGRHRPMNETNKQKLTKAYIEILEYRHMINMLLI